MTAKTPCQSACWKLCSVEPIVDGSYNFCTEKYGERPFRDEIDEEDYQSLLPMLGVKSFQPVLDAHFSVVVWR